MKTSRFLVRAPRRILETDTSKQGAGLPARKTTVDPETVLACMHERRFEAPLHRDEQLAIDLGIRGTPSVFVNGRRTIVRSVEDLLAALRAAVSQSGDDGVRGLSQ
ncbi:MAG: DsbA family protein [Bryobacteraceae bacterium]